MSKQVQVGSFKNDIFADGHRLLLKVTWRSVIRLAAWDPGFRAVSLFRLQSHAERRSRVLAIILSNLNLWLHGCDLRVGAKIGPGLAIRHTSSLVIGIGVTVGEQATLAHGVTLGMKSLRSEANTPYPRIGDRVSLGSFCQIIGDVDLCDDVTVGAMAVVTESVVKPFTTVVGVNKHIVGGSRDLNS